MRIKTRYEVAKNSSIPCGEGLGHDGDNYGFSRGIGGGGSGDDGIGLIGRDTGKGPRVEGGRGRI